MNDFRNSKKQNDLENIRELENSRDSKLLKDLKIRIRLKTKLNTVRIMLVPPPPWAKI